MFRLWRTSYRSSLISRSCSQNEGFWSPHVFNQQTFASLLDAALSMLHIVLCSPIPLNSIKKLVLFSPQLLNSKLLLSVL